MNKRVLCLLVLLVVSFPLFAQVKTVTGTVTDEAGSPLPGVGVLIQGTKKGTSTDFDGNYTLQVNEGGALEFSYIGFTTQTKKVTGAGNSLKINVVMKEEAQQLGEVVVTALGIKRETKKLGYAMTEMKGEELAKANTVNPVSALQGESAGVSIGSSDGGLFGNAKIQVRGVSSLNSNNNQPIFVIDGVILENNTSGASADWESNANDFGNILKNLNPDDYKSVSVLKGAAATALYGSRGINGVVLIETKNGSGAKGLGVSVKHSLGVDHVYATPELQTEYGQGIMAGYIDYGKTDANGRYFRFDTEQFYYDANGNPSRVNHPKEGLGYGPRFNENTMIVDYDGKLVPYRPYKNNLLKAYNLGVSNTTSVSLTGGNEKGNFYLSDSYNQRTGVLPNNGFSRNSLLFSGAYNLAPWLKAEASVSYTSSEGKNPRSDLATNFLTGVWTNEYDVEKYKQNQYWQAKHGGLPNSNYGDEYAYVPGNGIWFAYNKNNQVRNENVVRPIVKLSAEILKGLNVRLEGNLNYYTIKQENKELGNGYANEGGYYALYHYRDVSQTGKISLDYTKDITQDLSAYVVVGGEIWNQEKSETRVRTDGGLVVPGRYYLKNSKKTPIADTGRVFGTKQINSLYFLTSFSLKDQLFLDITGRNDWSSALVYTDGTGNYSYFYPSVSSSWVFSQTLGLPSWVSFGKLRASWAQVGSDTDPYSINKGYSLGSYEMNGGNNIYLNEVSTTLVDRSIKPERKNSYEVGLDARFFNNRLGFDVAYYDEYITNQIGDIPLPNASGYRNLLTNIGTLRNYGFELKVDAKPIRTNNFVWDVSFNYWRNRTQVTDLHKDYGAYKVLGGTPAYGNFRIGSVAFEGGEYGVLMSDSAPKKFQAKDANGNNIDDPRNGMPVLKWTNNGRTAYYERSGEVEEIGKMQPDFEGSLKNTFTYKGVSLSVMLDARFGGYMASFSNRYGTANGFLNTSLKARDAHHGGITWTSQYPDTKGKVFSDGIIVEGVFAPGTNVQTPAGTTQDVGGLTYREAMDKGYIEPSHGSTHTYFKNSWGQGVVNDDWFHEVNYVALRNISLGYTLPSEVSKRLKMRNLYLGVNLRNLGYLYNSLPNKLNPESFRGTTSTESFFERSFMPYTASYTFSVAIDF